MDEPQAKDLATRLRLAASKGSAVEELRRDHGVIVIGWKALGRRFTTRGASMLGPLPGSPPAWSPWRRPWDP